MKKLNTIDIVECSGLRDKRDHIFSVFSFKRGEWVLGESTNEARIVITVVNVHTQVAKVVMACSHWQFPQASDFLGSEAIYLILTLAMFPSNFYIYFMCLLQKSLA